MGQKAYETMSDEDFMNEVEGDEFAEVETEDTVETETGSEEETETETGEDDNTGSDTDVDEDENSGGSDEDEEHADSDEDDEIDSEESGDGDTQDDDDADSDEEDAEGSGDENDEAEELDDDVDADTSDQDADSDTDDTEDDGDFDFKAGYEKVQAIFEPFKANGREMKVENIDDARRLMQMGAGHTKFVAELRPELKLIKTLKDNGLLDPDKINHLIDLEKKNPDAIAKLVKESGINPMDIDTDKAEGYKPTSYETSDAQFELDQAIDSIKGSDSYDKSISVMGEQWDQASRNIIADNPEIVGVVDGHIKSGVFDIIQGHVDTERALGRLTGMSDVEAYRAAANQLQKSGALDGGEESSPDNSEKPAKKDNPLEKAVKKKQEAKRKKRRKAASPSKRKSSSKQGAEDFSDLSDEEFEKKYGAVSSVV